MVDISNKALAVLLTVSIAIYALGILIVPGNTITGAIATNKTAGTANVTVQSVVLITLLNNTVDFGVGFVNSSDNSCTLTSNSATKTAACQGFNAPAKNSSFVIENSGNVNVSVQINGSYPTARDFFCNSLVANQNCTLASPSYLWQSGNSEAGSCPGAGSSGNLNTSSQEFCTNLRFNSSSNEVSVAIQIVIPRDSRQGELRDNVTFIANS